MSAMTDYLEQQLINHIFRTGTFTKPTNLTIHLYTVAPSDAGGGTEVSGGSYAAVSRAPLDANWAAPTAGDGVTSNAAIIAFPAPTANWGSIVAWAIKDQSGNFLFTATLSVAKTVNSGDPAPQFNANALQITFA